MVSSYSGLSFSSQISGSGDLSAFICHVSNEPSACLNICDSLRHGPLQRSQTWYPVGVLGPPCTRATADGADVVCNVSLFQNKVFMASFRVVSSLWKRKREGGRLGLKLSTRWNCWPWACRNACSTGIPERISLLLADLSYCLNILYFLTRFTPVVLYGLFVSDLMSGFL